MSKGWGSVRNSSQSESIGGGSSITVGEARSLLKAKGSTLLRSKVVGGKKVFIVKNRNGVKRRVTAKQIIKRIAGPTKRREG